MAWAAWSTTAARRMSATHTWHRHPRRYQLRPWERMATVAATTRQWWNGSRRRAHRPRRTYVHPGNDAVPWTSGTRRGQRRRRTGPVLHPHRPRPARCRRSGFRRPGRWRPARRGVAANVGGGISPACASSSGHWRPSTRRAGSCIAGNWARARNTWSRRRGDEVRAPGRGRPGLPEQLRTSGTAGCDVAGGHGPARTCSRRATLPCHRRGA